MKKISTAHLLLVIITIVQFVLSWAVSRFHFRLPVVVSLLVSQLAILMPFVVYCIVTKQNPLKLIRFKKIQIHTVFLSVLIVFFSYPVVIFLNFISMLFVDNAMVDVMPQVLSMGLPVGMLLMAVVPAIVEETIFRGVIYNTYSRRRPIVGIFLSALLFGLMHMNFNQMMYAFYLGIIMALMMEACDSIIAPMIMHFTLNAMSTLVSFLSAGTLETTTAASMDFQSTLMESYRMSAAQMGMEMTEEQLSAMMPTIMTMVIGILAVVAMIALAIVLALIYAVFRSNGRKPSVVFKADRSNSAYVEKRNGEMRKNRMVDLFLLIFIIYTVIMCVLSVVL